MLKCQSTKTSNKLSKLKNQDKFKGTNILLNIFFFLIVFIITYSDQHTLSKDDRLDKEVQNRNRSFSKALKDPI